MARWTLLIGGAAPGNDVSNHEGNQQ